MGAPIIRRFNRAAPAALNVFQICLDQETGLGQTLMTNIPNAILDIVNSPDPAAGLTYQTNLWKGGKDQGMRFYSEALSAVSAGRQAIGPIDVTKMGVLQFWNAQTLGAVAAYNFIVKFAKSVEA